MLSCSLLRWLLPAARWLPRRFWMTRYYACRADEARRNALPLCFARLQKCPLHYPYEKVVW